MNRRITIRYDKRLYRKHNCLERVVGYLKINRAIATRYDQLADSFLGILYLASARYWIKFCPRALERDDAGHFDSAGLRRRIWCRNLCRPRRRRVCVTIGKIVRIA